MSMRPLTFAVATNRRDTLERNLLASPCFAGAHPHQILVQEGFSSAAAAYNDAVERSPNDLMIFVHQDMYLPENWLSDFESALQRLQANDPNWGVLGCSGKTQDNEDRGYVYSHGVGIVGEPFEPPQPVQTLDEIVLVFRKSSGLRFDETMPSFHMYGSDICLTAASRGMKSYAISAFCIHNTQWAPVLPNEFYDCYRHLKNKWKDSLPICTTCIQVTRFNLRMYERRLREMYRLYVQPRKPGERAPDTAALVEAVAALRGEI